MTNAKKKQRQCRATHPSCITTARVLDLIDECTMRYPHTGTSHECYFGGYWRNDRKRRSRPDDAIA